MPPRPSSSRRLARSPAPNSELICSDTAGWRRRRRRRRRGSTPAAGRSPDGGGGRRFPQQRAQPPPGPMAPGGGARRTPRRTHGIRFGTGLRWWCGVEGLMESCSSGGRAAERTGAPGACRRLASTESVGGGVGSKQGWRLDAERMLLSWGGGGGACGFCGSPPKRVRGLM